MKIIGRHSEKEELEQLYRDNRAHFVAVYGRRRIGKTYLIREFFKKKSCHFFHVTGVQHGDNKQQLQNFADSFSESFLDNIPMATLKNWREAFKLLNKKIMEEEKKKIVLFLDELPWLAARRSGLLQLMDYFWNRHWSARKNVMLIVCGSSASWIIKKIINNRGGLHNRVTRELKLSPFTLKEVKEYLMFRKVKFNIYQILELYMALGGVPYYLDYVDGKISASKNIQKIFFGKAAPLRDELQKLFSSLFADAFYYADLVKLIASKRQGLTRTEITKDAKFSMSGGRLSERLNDLCRAGFIESYTPWGKRVGEYYKVIDEFSLFYFSWVASSKNNHFASSYWEHQINKPAYKAWRGYAFESVCAKHITEIVSVLHTQAAGVIGSWSYRPKKPNEVGAQIDLVIDCIDGTIILGEEKYTDHPFVIDKEYAKNLKNKMTLFQTVTKTEQQIFLIIISARGVKPNFYQDELISQVITLKDLVK